AVVPPARVRPPAERPASGQRSPAPRERAFLRGFLRGTAPPRLQLLLQIRSRQFDLVQPKHVRRRTAPAREVRLRARTEVSKTQRERPSRQRDRSELLLERCQLVPLP